MAEDTGGEAPYRLVWRDGLAIVHLTCGKANALNPRSLAAIERALDEAAGGGARGVVLTGYERFFSAGLDLVTLYGIGASPDMWLVLLAFVAASILGMIPFSPGGLGFVEAGLVGTLALSGITTAQAVLATLVFRLVSFWLPIPIGLGAWWLFRRRYPRARAITS